MGRMKNGTTFESYTPELTTLGIPQPNVQKTGVPNRVQLIPGFEQKIGFSYLASLGCVQLDFAIGYQCQIYLNAVQTTDMSSQAVPPDTIESDFPTVGVFAQGFERTLSNYIQTGPYAALDIRF